MYGPQPKTRWLIKPSNFLKRYQHLNARRRYVVCRSFVDYDGDEHPVGEEWDFLFCSLFPYEMGVTLHVTLDSKREWLIRMQHEDDQQGEILENLELYIKSTSG